MHGRLLAMVVAATGCACGGGGDDSGGSREAPPPVESRAVDAAVRPTASRAYVQVSATALRVSPSPAATAATSSSVPAGELEANVRELLSGAPAGAPVLLLAEGAVPAAKLLDAAVILAALKPRLATPQAGAEPTAHATSFVPLPPVEESWGTMGVGRYAPDSPRYDPNPPPPRRELGPARFQIILHPERLIVVDSWADRGALPHVDGRPAGRQLEVELRQRLSRSPDLLVAISAEPGTTVQALVAVLDAGAAAGVTAVAPAAPDAKVFVVGGLRPRRETTGRPSRVPVARLGTGTITGPLDPLLIRRYLRRKAAHLLYCYEKQLFRDPGLQGTVVVQFSIEGNGAVRDSTASGVSPEVSRCIQAVVASIEFPKPKGGGLVQASYPIELEPSSE